MVLQVEPEVMVNGRSHDKFLSRSIIRRDAQTRFNIGPITDDYKRRMDFNASTGQYFVDPYRTGDQAAQETLADLYEAEYQDYLNRFLPVQQQLISEVSEDFPV